MNKFTGAKNLTDKDVQNIEKMCAAGMDLQTISDITGWGREVCRKIRKGNYYELRQRAKAAREQAKIEYAEPIKSLMEQVAEDMETRADTEPVTFIKNINLSLFEIDKKLGAICNELKVEIK